MRNSRKDIPSSRDPLMLGFTGKEVHTSKRASTPTCLARNPQLLGQNQEAPGALAFREATASPAESWAGVELVINPLSAITDVFRLT